MADIFNTYHHRFQVGCPANLRNMATNGEILALEMTDLGLKDADVAAKAGYDSANSIYRMRVGSTKLDDRKLAKILVAIGADPSKYELPTGHLAAQHDQEQFAALIEELLARVSLLPKILKHLENQADDLAAIKSHLGITE